MNQVTQELVQVVVPGAKTPWGIPLLKLDCLSKADFKFEKESQEIEKEKESLGKEDASKQGRISTIDANQDIYLVNVHRDEDIFGVNDQDDTSKFDADKDLQGEEVVVEKKVAGKDASGVEEINASIATSVTATTLTISMDEITLAKACIKINTSKPKAKGIVMQEPSKTPTPLVSSQQPSKVQNKDYGLAQRLQAEEQEQLTDVKNLRLFMDFLKKRRKLFAAKRAKEKRNKPPTKAQQRSLMYTYLKNMDGWKTRALKNKSFADIQDLFNKAMKRVNMFMDIDTKVVKSTKKDKAQTVQESSSKRAGDELKQESSKKQKIKDENESEELKRCLEIVPDDRDDVTVDTTPLSTKSPTIVDYKIYKKGRKRFF
nr:hypothetical protein [Tanacetum cinerariifolium]